MTLTRADKAKQFRSLHEAPEAFVIANVWDGGSARMMAALGFAALATSSGASAGLLTHPPAMAAVAGKRDIDLVLFDLGGTIYDDSTYTRALLRAVHEIDPNVQEEEFWAVYDAQRMRASGSLRTNSSP